MKTNTLMMAFVSLFAIVSLSSCNKDEDEDYVVTIKVGEPVGVVKAQYNNSYTAATAAEAHYSNGEYILNLPATVIDTHLGKLYPELNAMPDGITVSNPNVKGVSVMIFVYISETSKYPTGRFDYGKPDWLNGFSELTYVTEDVSITGSEITGSEIVDIKATWNVHLKKGWNIVCTGFVEDAADLEIETTTQIPADAKWYFSPFIYEGPEPFLQGVSVKKIPALFGKSNIGFFLKNNQVVVIKNLI
jgi:hypothetical protein